jgi:mannose-1-phosphate guanylyltransferase
MKADATNQNRHAIILAGGDGTRLSEITRRISGDSTPKQFCPVIGNTSLLEQTRLRAALVVDKKSDSHRAQPRARTPLPRFGQ